MERSVQVGQNYTDLCSKWCLQDRYQWDTQNHKEIKLFKNVTAFPDIVFSVEGTRPGSYGLNST